MFRSQQRAVGDPAAHSRIGLGTWAIDGSTWRGPKGSKGSPRCARLTPRHDWLRGSDLNRRPLSYEGVGTSHRRRHRTKGAGTYAPPFRLVWSAIASSTR